MVLSHCCDLSSFPDDFKWDSWWTKWHCSKFFSKLYGFPVLIVTPLLTILTYQLIAHSGHINRIPCRKI